MNVKLLRKVKEHILAEPRRLSMGTWLADARTAIGNPKDRPPCGTVGCIAGNACIIAGLATEIERDGKTIFLLPPGGSRVAQNALDLTHAEACRLFLVDESWGDGPYEGSSGHWPEEFIKKFKANTSKVSQAKVAAARIEHFIKTKGRE